SVDILDLPSFPTRRSSDLRTHRGFGPCRDRGCCFRRGLRTGVGFRYGAVCGFYRTGGLSHYEDEAQEYLVADELRRCRRYEFRNTSDFIQRTKVEKDAAGVLPAPSHYHPGVIRACHSRRTGGTV